MNALIRQQFLDLTWDSVHLNAASEFWLRLYEIAAKHYAYDDKPHYSLEIRLWGFPRCNAEKLAKELERRAQAFNVETPVVTIKDPDTIILSSKEVSGPLAPDRARVAAIRRTGIRGPCY
jgi:hypothetical protein